MWQGMPSGAPAGSTPGAPNRRETPARRNPNRPIAHTHMPGDWVGSLPRALGALDFCCLDLLPLCCRQVELRMPGGETVERMRQKQQMARKPLGLSILGCSHHLAHNPPCVACTERLQRWAPRRPLPHRASRADTQQNRLRQRTRYGSACAHVSHPLRFFSSLASAAGALPAPSPVAARLV